MSAYGTGVSRVCEFAGTAANWEAVLKRTVVAIHWAPVAVVFVSDERMDNC